MPDINPLEIFQRNKPTYSFQNDMGSYFQNRIQGVGQRIKDVAQPAVEAAKGFVSPLAGQFNITQKFGNYNPALYQGIVKDNRHKGLDLATPQGTDVRAPISGTVKYGTDKNWGNYAEIVGEDGNVYRFSHLSALGNLSGQVQPGQVLGKTGATGNVTGPHLDISVRKNGQFVDPLSISWLAQFLQPQGGGGFGEKFKAFTGSIRDRLKRFLEGEKIVLYADGKGPQESPQPKQETAPSPEPAKLPEKVSPTSISPDALRRMVAVYGGKDAPIMGSVDKMAAEANKYDFWRNNPELLALLPHLETSSGRNVTRPNNWTNWGIANPENNPIFAKMTPLEVYSRMLSGIGERMGNYDQFRTGAPLTDEQLLQFANIYEPANKAYGPNLVNGRNFIRKQLEGVR